MTTIKVFIIDKNGVSVEEIENDYRAINQRLGWDDAWNTPTIRVECNDYICICADLGKIRHEPISAMTLDNLFEVRDFIKEPFIVGAIMITKFDGTDDFESLTEQDIALLKSRVLNIPSNKPIKECYHTILILD